MPKVVADYKELAKARITRAGIAIFAKKGFRNSSMADIAKEVGVSKADLYLYFRNKADILREIQTASRRQTREELSRIPPEGDTITALLDLVERALAEGSQDSRIGALWFEMMAEGLSDPKLGAVLRADYREDRKIIRDILPRLSKRGRARTLGDPDATAMVVTMLLSGAIAQMCLGTPWPQVRRALERALRAVLEG
jgi:AcrR family transcriptional regulator